MAGFLNKNTKQPAKTTGKPSSASAPQPARGVSDSSVVRRDHDTRHPESQQYMRRDRKAQDYC